MSCLALSLQPVNGPDILLQTREWFPPARALVAVSAFRTTRLAFSSAAAATSSLSSKHHNDDVSGDPTIVGDDPLAASSGQVIVGVESRYRVVYRLVNSIYVLGVTTVDDDDDNSTTTNNVFECISIVNQAVSVVVTACRGVDVTPEKLGKKYAEIYMAMDIVLRGVSNIRLAAMLGSMHGDSIAKMVHSAVDTENKVRGADNWAGVAEGLAVEHEAGVDSFSSMRFELPSETLTAGDEVGASIAIVGQAGLGEQDGGVKIEEEQGVKDPFAASDSVSKPESLVGEFKKDKDVTLDMTKALVGLEVTPLPPAEAANPTRIAVEGFEGDYGGIEFGNEEASLRETFEGFSDAFGGGLDASEFVGPSKVAKREGLGGLELLQTGPDRAPVAASGAGATPLENLLVQKTEMKGPEMFIVEEISAEFRESLLSRVGLRGVIYLRTLSPKMSGEKETEFSFKIDGTNSVKRTVVQSSRVSSLGNGMFHVRTAASEEPLPVLKYSLMPQMTPIPLRVRLVKRHVGTLLSIMIQYVSNPDLLVPLSDVTFILKLPVDPSILNVSPKAVLNRSEKELKWHVQEIPLKGTPGKLRARMPIDINEEDTEEEIDVVCYVKFSVKGATTLSGVSLCPASEAKTDFYVVDHKVESGDYMCN
ncbi:hypothetical protein SOVF_182590 [Spinacia oleracea]|uniref:MHD domain-containing protein n=1 Tax=Spinacia oleracea TaxID=3562 RepID=A0A9R0JJG2_SPIOL|nr:uncharacterized protein LOC110776595 [Spinacia oleracea]KNA06283.1 hypothetical protein SOVF_182590 [Spinacia oleracea]